MSHNAFSLILIGAMKVDGIVSFFGFAGGNMRKGGQVVGCRPYCRIFLTVAKCASHRAENRVFSRTEGVLADGVACERL